MEERRNLVVEEFTYFALTQSVNFDEEFHKTMLAEIDEELDNLKEQLTQLREDSKLGDDVGPCQASIDVTLKSLNVERQAYYGGCIIGNQCHKLLFDKKY